MDALTHEILLRSGFHANRLPATSPYFFAAVPVRGDLRQQIVRRPRKRGDSQEGEFPLLCACRACGIVPARRSGRKSPMYRGACTFRKELPIKGKNGSLLPPFIIQISLQDQCGCHRIYVFTVLLLFFAAAVQNVVCSNRGAPLVPQHDRQTGLRAERIR